MRSFFDGRTAAELRLWDALGADLLCPFHYFVVADGTDLRSINWSRGRYDEDELSNVFTGNDARARVVLNQLRDKVSDVGRHACPGLLRERCARGLHGESVQRGGNPRAGSEWTDTAEPNETQALAD